MTAKVITVTSGKGGVGKTTTVANIAVALAASGKKVVCIDGDIGLRNLDVIMGLENRIVYDIVDIIEGRCRTRQAMIRDKRMPELFLIPAAQTRDKNAVSPSDMVQNSRGNPPASHTPRFTASATWRRCALQLFSSLQELQMPITGLPSNTRSLKPSARSQARWANPQRSSFPNQSRLRSLRFVEFIGNISFRVEQCYIKNQEVW